MRAPVKNTEISLRRFQLTDLPRIMEIEHSSFGAEAYSEEQFLWRYKSNPEGFIVACVGEEVVGYVTGLLSGQKGHLDSIVVKKEFRGKGIGRQLNDFILNYFQKKKVKVIELEVRPENKKVINWYKRLGFKIVKRIKDYYPDGGDAYLMRKNL